MENEFIKYEEALALKELGFDELCFDSYEPRGLMGHTAKNSVEWIIHNPRCCSAPLYQQAFRWFREEHGLHSITVPSLKKGKFHYHRFDLLDKGRESEPELCSKYGTPEEAELACLKKLIEIVKKKS